MTSKRNPAAKVESKCPHCGYCEHCGRSDRVAPYPYPYPVPYPVYPRPWQPRHPWSSPWIYGSGSTLNPTVSGGTWSISPSATSGGTVV